MEPIVNEKVWIITGATTGFGFILVEKLLTLGHKVTATTRNKDKLNQKVTEQFKEKPEVLQRFLACQVDLSDLKSIEACITQTVEKFGRLDNLVNNAGYFTFGLVEEISDKEFRENLEVNFFGPVNFAKLALPHLRESAKTNTTGPRILNISSMLGIWGELPGFVSYVSSKFALDGFSEVLHGELKPLNIHVTSVKPGGFKTEILMAEPNISAFHPHPSGAYPNINEEYCRGLMVSLQKGDPSKLCDILINQCNLPNPPLHLMIGADAYDIANKKMKRVADEMEQFRAEATATDLA
ncbi:short-chain dehydrogenase/reductase family protein [Heterostelium album PN500]|uniref:Short-chain dehydrogenase/reductase family protein n=1 Tax=Heterostelium pallidum (strain ATCC 26659 / Pp 5 / PN500) TaxID=670386 RepID=D3BUR9_HETP5|nr:short-chain dehydrogenase/reductase family protein [Heterostelium album PN500]EFA74857.1 short-chain dehydrogenase/reductase family protein [Heterostelium album PN500]|eukprot:XP_020426991.1 short-chain dehydrogenase/reductase family protein [Heterostelium album PN500]